MRLRIRWRLILPSIDLVPFHVLNKNVPTPTVHQHRDHATGEPFTGDVVVDKVLELCLSVSHFVTLMSDGSTIT